MEQFGEAAWERVDRIEYAYQDGDWFVAGIDAEGSAIAYGRPEDEWVQAAYDTIDDAEREDAERQERWEREQ